MQAKTVHDLGARGRTARRALGWTQADLARRVGVSREWVIRFEGGHPRLEAQKVLDVLSALGLVLDVSGTDLDSASKPLDDFDALFAKQKR